MHRVLLACLPGWGGPSPGETHTPCSPIPDPGLNCTSHTQEAPQKLLPRNLPKPQHGSLQRWASKEVSRWDGVPRVGAQGRTGEDPARSEAQGPPCSPSPQATTGQHLLLKLLSAGLITRAETPAPLGAALLTPRSCQGALWEHTLTRV